MIKSPMNMVGYYKGPQGAREGFTEDGFFRTGDIVQLDADGQVKIIGRVKEQFKTSKGKYVAPAPIESMLMAHPAIEACCVMGAGLPSPFAVVVLSPDARKRCAAPADARSTRAVAAGADERGQRPGRSARANEIHRHRRWAMDNWE